MKMQHENEWSWNIRDWGARGDGKTKDTMAIQKAVDACHAAGGGRVRCPPGAYLAGSLLLKSGVELHLEQGAVLRGSPDIADYLTGYCAGYYAESAHAAWDRLKIVRAHLVCAVQASRVALTGPGTIDGNGSAFFGPIRPASDLKRFSVPDRRPSHMVAFYECEDIRVEDVHLLHSPCYTLWPYACSRVTIDGVTVHNHPSTPNGDGINPDSCRDVLIRGCLIDTADDAVAIKSMSLPECGITKACENVIVTGCVLRSCCMGVRLGVEGDSPIRNVILSDLVIAARCGLAFYAVEMKNFPYPIRHGTPIENVRCSNIVMETALPPILAMMNGGAGPPAGIRNLTFNHVAAVSPCASLLYGKPDLPIESVRMDNVRLTICGPMREKHHAGAVPPPAPYGGKESLEIPHALYGRHLRDFSMSNVQVEWKDASGPWRSSVRLDDAADVMIDRLDASQAPGNQDGVAVHLNSVRGARIDHCRWARDTGAFLGLEGGADDIYLHGNQTAKDVRLARVLDDKTPDPCASRA